MKQINRKTLSNLIIYIPIIKQQKPSPKKILQISPQSQCLQKYFPQKIEPIKNKIIIKNTDQEQINYLYYSIIKIQIQNINEIIMILVYIFLIFLITMSSISISKIITTKINKVSLILNNLTKKCQKFLTLQYNDAMKNNISLKPIKATKPIKQTLNIDIIKQTKKLVANKSQQERFIIAKKHLFNALDYKTPRIDINKDDTPTALSIVYNIHTYFIWRYFLFICAYVYMYASFFGAVHPSPVLIGFQFILLGIFISDLWMQIYHKRYNILKPSSKFQARFYFKATVIILLVIDSLICCSTQSLPIRPFLILRCILPLMYDQHMRKLTYALFASYKDIFVYILFFLFVLISFSIMANQFIHIPQDQDPDPFAENYQQLSKTIYIMYVLTTFDAYPDNQAIAIQQNEAIYAFFIIFIFLNALFFVTIPTNILLNSIKQTRSKSVIIDQIGQQHSLIMAYIALGGDTRTNITYQHLIRFLLFVYNDHPKQIDKITQICQRLDQKVNGSIEVNQFMQLCKIIQSNNYLWPPRFKVPEKLARFQNLVDNKLKFRAILTSNKYQAIVSILILFTFVNCIITLYLQDYQIFDIFDSIFMVFYVVEVTFKIIGLGPFQFFQQNMNIFDLIIVTLGCILQIAPQEDIPNKAYVIIKMFRIFRVTVLIKLIAEYFHFDYRSQIYGKFIQLINQIAMIFPIVLKFFPLYLLSFYFLGVVGLQVFHNETDQKTPYDMYNQFSNFKTLLGSQFIMVQALTQAGWSLIAYDHAFKYGWFALTMLFFVITHEVIVIILTSLMKGVTWQVYNTIHKQIDNYQQRMIQDENNFKNLKKRFDIIQFTKQKIQHRQNVLPQNLVTRQLYQKKIDQIILAKLIQLQTKNKAAFFHKKKSSKNNQIMPMKKRREAPHYRSILIGDIFSSKKLNQPFLQKNINNNNVHSATKTSGSDQDSMQNLKVPINQYNQHSQNKLQRVNRQPLTSLFQSSDSQKQVGQLKQQDIEQQIDNVLSHIVMHSGIKYSLKIQYPACFVQFLKAKLKPLAIDNFHQQFDLNKDVFAKKNSLNLLVHGIHTLLELKTSDRQHRLMILSTMVKKGLITEERAQKLLTQRSFFDRELIIDYNWIIRKMYLSNVDESSIKMLQMQYFSSVYGQSFKQINKMTIIPLMKLQARLTYCFSNLLRYRQISTYQFFNTLSHIQNKISTKLLRQGSLCKFVYQIDTNSQTWFTVQLKDSNQLRVHFVKNGIWIYHEQMKKDQIYVGRDAFNWPNFHQQTNQQQCAIYIKNFFQNFESLAFCINDYQTFFQPQPQRDTFDLYTFYRQVQACKRYTKKQLSISKIMLVLLSKQQQKQQPLPYTLSDLKYDDDTVQAQKKKDMPHFKLDETESQIFQRLKKLQKDQDMISDRQGMPFAYIINFLIQIRQTMVLNERNFVFHVQNLLNQHFKQTQFKKSAVKKSGMTRRLSILNKGF